jgi:hypothetical protein
VLFLLLLLPLLRCMQEYPEEHSDVTQWCRHLAGWVGSDHTLWAVIASRTASSCDPCPDTAAAMLVDFFTDEKVSPLDA